MSKTFKLDNSIKDFNEAVALYTQGQQKDNTDPQVIRILAFASLKDFEDLEGNLVTVRAATAFSEPVMEQAEALAGALVRSYGMTLEEAVEVTLGSARKTFYVWKDIAIARTLFDGISFSGRLNTGRQVLERFYNSFTEEAGVDPIHITVAYLPDPQAITFSGGGLYNRIDQSDIAAAGEYILGEA